MRLRTIWQVPVHHTSDPHLRVGVMRVVPIRWRVHIDTPLENTMRLRDGRMLWAFEIASADCCRKVSLQSIVMPSSVMESLLRIDLSPRVTTEGVNGRLMGVVQFGG